MSYSELVIMSNPQPTPKPEEKKKEPDPPKGKEKGVESKENGEEVPKPPGYPIYRKGHNQNPISGYHNPSSSTSSPLQTVNTDPTSYGPTPQSNTFALMTGIGTSTASGMTTLVESYSDKEVLRGIQRALIDLSTKISIMAKVQYETLDEVKALRKKVDELQDTARIILEASVTKDAPMPQPGTSAPTPGINIYPLSNNSSPAGSVDWSEF